MNLVIFDFDGTMCDTQKSIFHTLKQVYDEEHININDEVINNKIKSGCTLKDSFIQINTEFNLACDVDYLVQKYRHIYNQTSYKLTKIFPGITELIETLYNNNITIIVLSNKSIQALNKILTMNNLSHYIDYIIGADSTPYNKPDSRLYSQIIKMRYPYINEANTYMIGDTITDIEFAKNTNLKSCFIKYGYGNIAKCLLLNPDMVINNLDELYKIKELYI